MPHLRLFSAIRRAMIFLERVIIEEQTGRSDRFGSAVHFL